MYLTDEQIMLLEQLTYLTDDVADAAGCSSARMTAWRICSSSLMMMRCKGLKIREILTAQRTIQVERNGRPSYARSKAIRICTVWIL